MPSIRAESTVDEDKEGKRIGKNGKAMTENLLNSCHVSRNSCTAPRRPKGLIGAIRRVVFTLAAAASIAGTLQTSVADKKAEPKYHFFPPAPDQPRIQFLVSFGAEHDLRGGKGGLMKFITGAAPKDTTISKPYGLAIRKNIIYVCDTGYSQILKVDLDAKKISGFESRGQGQVKMPVNIAVDDDGTVYVADSARDEVVIFDNQENFFGAFGGKNVMKPRDVAVTKDRLFVGDLLSHNIHVYNRTDRKLLFDVPRGPDATNVTHKLFQPANIAVDSKGNIYASDVGSDRVQVYDPEGKYLRSVGQYGDNAGEFSRPKGIALDRDDRLYAVDAATQVAQIFDSTGRILMWFGDPRTSNVGLQLPAKVVIDYDNVAQFQKYAAPDFQVEYLILITSQFGPRKVSVFGFGHRK
jgi:hypothetical protein